MISFVFHINKAFLEAADHPITIPFEHHYNLRQKVLGRIPRAGDQFPLTIHDPAGRSHAGHIYFGEAGGRNYFQVRLANALQPSYRHAISRESSARIYIGRIDGQIQVFVLNDVLQQEAAKLAIQNTEEGDRVFAAEIGKLLFKPEGPGASPAS